MNRNFIPYIYILFSVFIFQEINGQEIQLKIVAVDTINSSFLKSIEYKKRHDSEESIQSEIDSISLKLSKIGFLENYIESIHKKDSILTTYFFLGMNTQQIILNYSNSDISLNLLNQLSISHNQSQFFLTINQIPNFLNSIVSEYEKRGDSFIQASLKNITKSKDGLIADLHIIKSTNRTIDHIIVKGYEKFPQSFIKHYLNLKIGSVFNTSKLKEVSTSIQSLSFISEIKSPEILFAKDSTTIYLYLQKNKNNKFDGLIGFSSNESGKLKFNGYLDLSLNNIFNKGESISVYWKSNGEDRKFFNVEINTPFIFGSPISPKATFNIYKQDSTFLNTKANIDIIYLFNPKNSLSVMFQTESSNNLSETFQNSNIETFKNTFYGMSYTFKQPDFQRSFQNKFYISISALWGNRTISSNMEKETQSKYEILTYYLWSLNSKNSIFIQNNSGTLLSNILYTNELYRIGGANSIRGFNEESIFSSTFSVMNIEYRYNISPTSYLYSITDYAYVQNKVINTNTSLYGFGLGYNYKTKSGLIDISYALGKQKKTPFDFNNSKFHIKLTQYF